MEYKEDDFLMISGIQHFAFCRRQWALIHIEQQWAENVRTIEGELMHKRAHDPKLREKSGDTFTIRALPVSSRKLGISGECDVVEFQKVEDGVRLHGHRGMYQIYPIEYKRGQPKNTDIDILQLTAQVMCLEEMFTAEISEGAIFYGEIRRRDRIAITEELRAKVESMVEEMHQLYRRGYTPRVKWSKSCNACSLNEICMPKLGKSSDVNKYIEEMIREEGE